MAVPAAAVVATFAFKRVGVDFPVADLAEAFPAVVAFQEAANFIRVDLAVNNSEDRHNSYFPKEKAMWQNWVLPNFPTHPVNICGW